MESSEARELARTLARAEAAPYLSYPKLPRYYPVVFAAWFAAMAAALGHLGSPWAFVAVVVLLIAEIVFLRWFSRAHGAMPWPGRGNPPPEIARLYRAYYVGAALVLVAIALTWWLAGLWPAVAVTFVLTAAGLWLYDRRYEKAAATVRERLHDLRTRPCHPCPEATGSDGDPGQRLLSVVSVPQGAPGAERLRPVQADVRPRERVLREVRQGRSRSRSVHYVHPH